MIQNTDFYGCRTQLQACGIELSPHREEQRFASKNTIHKSDQVNSSVHPYDY
jgi:hypothetical protein